MYGFKQTSQQTIPLKNPTRKQNAAAAIQQLLLIVCKFASKKLMHSIQSILLAGGAHMASSQVFYNFHLFKQDRNWLQFEEFMTRNRWTKEWGSTRRCVGSEPTSTRVHLARSANLRYFRRRGAQSADLVWDRSRGRFPQICQCGGQYPPRSGRPVTLAFCFTDRGRLPCRLVFLL